MAIDQWPMVPSIGLAANLPFSLHSPGSMAISIRPTALSATGAGPLVMIYGIVLRAADSIPVALGSLHPATDNVSPSSADQHRSIGSPLLISDLFSLLTAALVVPTA